MTPRPDERPTRWPAAEEPSEWPSGVPRAVHREPIGGGFVARTWRVGLADGTDAVVKVTPFPAEAEQDGLRALRAAGVPAPEVRGVAGHTLVLELVTGEPRWADVGRAVAGMHSCIGPAYGWHRDNWAGAFPQENGWLEDWPSFFVSRRVRTHLADPRLPADLRRRLERACDGAIQAVLPERPTPVLTHGDLWRGNVVAGRAVVDPEVCYADRELDLAYMEMSSSDPLPPEFWAAYLEVAPLSEGYQERRRVLELHHRLLQVRHFGAASVGPLAELLEERGW